jgi:hypothetical protein
MTEQPDRFIATVSATIERLSRRVGRVSPVQGNRGPNGHLTLL